MPDVNAIWAYLYKLACVYGSESPEDTAQEAYLKYIKSGSPIILYNSYWGKVIKSIMCSDARHKRPVSESMLREGIRVEPSYNPWNGTVDLMDVLATSEGKQLLRLALHRGSHGINTRMKMYNLRKRLIKVLEGS